MTSEQHDARRDGDCRPKQGTQPLPKQEVGRGDGHTAGGDEIGDCVAYAEEALRKMAEEVARNGYSGTIGIEIPVDHGKLGKVKRLKIFFQQQ